MTKKQAAIEARITMEIIVDCYDDDEQTTGWYCYLEQALHFPFKAQAIEKRRHSPLTVGQVIEVIGMGNQDDCHLNEMWVDICWQSDTLNVPLAQLKPIKADKSTTEAMDAWHYWVEQGLGN